MEEKIQIVTEEVNENTEETVEETLVDGNEEVITEPVATITEEQLKERLARQERSITRRLEKEYNEKLSKYQQTESILKQGLEVDSIDDANATLKNFYKDKGINIPETSPKEYSDWEVEVLAKAEAEELVNDGFDEMEREANRLAKIGFKNLNKKDQIIFNTIAGKLVIENNKKALAKNGIDSAILEDKDFINFTNKFKSTENIVDVYNMYSKNKTEQKQIKPIGSMKNEEVNKEKDYYTPEEARKLTIEDYKKDPKLKDIVVKSAAIWQEKGL